MSAHLSGSGGNPVDSVSVLGAGPMGTAIVNALLSAGRSVTVWNRTPEKLKPLEARGATVAESVDDAFRKSALSILCIADTASVKGLLTGSALRAAEQRLVVNLSTGTPREARELRALLQEGGASFLSGAVLVTPSQIGSAEAALLAAGPSQSFAAAERSLRDLAPGLQYVGEDVGAASALDLAFLSHFFGGLLGFYHGARIIESEGLPVRNLGDMIQAVAPALGTIISEDAKRIERGSFDAAESTLRNSATVIDLISRHATESGLHPAFPAFASKIFRAGMAAGFAERDVASLLEILRRPAEEI